MTDAVTVVLDIGKTNVKLCALDLTDGTLVDCRRTGNSVSSDGPYPHVDVERIWHWLLSNLAEISQSLDIRSIGITTHGATVACLAGDELALPIPDYENQNISQTRLAYDRVRPLFDETRSPCLPVGLNIGAQLFWLQQTYASAFSRTTALLTYPQYWGWRLTGVAVSELTSLGCHTDLWDPESGDFSSLVESQGWRCLFPDLVETGASLGALKPELAKELGLSEGCQVFNGIHDSNASLVPHLLQRDAPFGVVSSGTWTVIAGVGSPLSGLDETADMLANVNAFGEAVPCIRFMGGREWEALRTEEEADARDLEDILDLGVYAIPAFTDQGGAFHAHTGRFVGPMEQLSGAQRTALASLYVALMTDFCLNLLQQHGDLVVEGAFATNELYMSVLASLRYDQRVLRSDDETGTTLGTAMLSHQRSGWTIDYTAISADQRLTCRLAHYRARWRNLCPDIAELPQAMAT